MQGRGRENFGRGQADTRNEDEASSSHSFKRGAQDGRIPWESSCWKKG